MSVKKPAKKGKRSSRLYYRAVVTPAMDGDHTIINKATMRASHPSAEEREAHPEKYYDMYTIASSYAENREPYRAFMRQRRDGWLTAPGGLGASWIVVNPSTEWRSPSAGKYFEILVLETYNPLEQGMSAKRFFFEGLIGNEFVTFKVCDIKDAAPGAKNVFYIPMERDDAEGGPVTPRQACEQYRILIHSVQDDENQTQVGFSCINMYAMMDHADVTFGYGTVGSTKRPMYHEKMAYFNDDSGCDGIIWEKKHDGNIILTAGSYSYNYSSYSDTVLIHPKEKHVNNRLGPVAASTSLAMLTRAKDYAIKQDNYYNYYGDYDPAGRPMYTSKDGVHWVKTNGLHTEDGYVSRWSPKENVGLLFGLAARDPSLSDRFQYQINKLEIEDDGHIKQTYLGHYKKDFPDSLTFCGDVMLKDEGEGHMYWSAWDHDGHKYTTALKRAYTYANGSTTYSTTFSYNFYVMGGKYVAAAERIIGYDGYWRYTYEVWLSDDGFKTVQGYDLAGPPWTDGSDWSYQIMYFNEHWMCYRYSDQNRWYYLRDFGKNMGGSYTDRALLNHSKFDIQGNYTSHKDDVQKLVYYIGNSPTAGTREKLIGGSGYVYQNPNRITGYDPVIYFKDGKVSEPYDYMVVSFDYTFGDWDADYRTFLLFEGDFTHEPKMKMCFTGKNPMIDPGNDSWKHYW